MNFNVLPVSYFVHFKEIFGSNFEGNCLKKLRGCSHELIVMFNAIFNQII
jgi:hypothetical protein